MRGGELDRRSKRAPAAPLARSTFPTSCVGAEALPLQMLLRTTPGTILEPAAKLTWPSKMETSRCCRNQAARLAGERRAVDGHPGKHIHGFPLPVVLPTTYPKEAEPRVIQQQQNQTKNNPLVLMGLVLSLPRTFQPGSRDRSRRGGRGG